MSQRTALLLIASAALALAGVDPTSAQTDDEVCPCIFIPPDSQERKIETTAKATSPSSATPPSETVEDADAANATDFGPFNESVSANADVSFSDADAAAWMESVLRPDRYTVESLTSAEISVRGDDTGDGNEQFGSAEAKAKSTKKITIDTSGGTRPVRATMYVTVSGPEERPDSVNASINLTAIVGSERLEESLPFN
ncbi:MAG: hypothetical protein K8E66_01775, partial [Phycisphaerales bacterium]|nr:hypothetical protein [Phycisphaerales bacterium]